MSKITFRADDELVEAIERFDASKSEVMREALRQYLDSHEESTTGQGASPEAGTIDELIADRVDSLVAEAIDRHLQTPDVNVTVNLEADAASVDKQTQDERMTYQPSDPTMSDDALTCEQCGTSLDPDDVYCPNCGEKVFRRLFCECGDEIRSDWAFCPSCGRRTPAADVLDGADRH
ncbi:MAG: double zinc ribbon domain-containing protein [Salinarchaeum sp.]